VGADADEPSDPVCGPAEDVLELEDAEALAGCVVRPLSVGQLVEARADEFGGLEGAGGLEIRLSGLVTASTSGSFIARSLRSRMPVATPKRCAEAKAARSASFSVASSRTSRRRRWTGGAAKPRTRIGGAPFRVSGWMRGGRGPGGGSSLALAACEGQGRFRAGMWA
jgi:hypothetical protein